MRETNWLILNKQYKELKAKADDKSLTSQEAIELNYIKMELSRRGYLLSADESTWMNPKKYRHIR